MQAEYQLPIQDFTGSVTYRKPYESGLADMLRQPTRTIARVYAAIVPTRLWYRAVFEGDYKDPKARDEFKKNFDLHSTDRFLLRSPYTYIDNEWGPRSIASFPTVRDVLREASDELEPAIAYINQNAPDKNARGFGDHLSSQAKHLRNGELGALMGDYLDLSPEQRIIWACVFAEYLDDTLLGIKASPQAFLARVLRGKTRLANEKIEIYEKSAQDHNLTLARPNVFVADMDICSGWLGVGDKRISAQNLPNTPSDKIVISQFPKRIAKRNETISPLAKEYLGFATTQDDLEEYILAHEYAHGYRVEGEAERLEVFRSHVKEGVANFKGIILASSRRFSEEHLHRVARGLLGFGLVDLEDDVKVAFNRFGLRQPGIDKLLSKDNPYRLSANLALYYGNRTKAIRHPMGRVNLDKFIPCIEELDRDFDDLTRYGDEEEVRRYAKDTLLEMKFYPVSSVLKELFSSVRNFPLARAS